MRLVSLLRCCSPSTATCAALVMLMGGGCGAASSTPLDQQAAAPTTNSTPADAQQATHAADADKRDPRTKWIGGIPYDVFFDQPLMVAADEGSADSVRLNDNPPPKVAHVENTTSALTSAGHDTPQSTTETATARESAADWKRLAALDVLNEEVKQVRNRLTANLRTVATYNRNIDAIINDAVVLAAIGAVVAAHPESISWQDNAKFVRDLSAEVAARATGTGREAFSAAQKPFEQIVNILNGGPPPEIEATDTVPFSEVAERGELMKRIKRSFDWLKAEINTESRFRESPDDIVREATVLAVFGGLISTESYDSADEPQYQQFVREFIDANLAMTAAVDAGDFELFTIGRDRVQNACAACHGEYAFGDEGL